MNPELARLLNNTLPGALSVFVGSLPLLGVIAWFTYQQSDRFRRIEERVDKLDSRIESRMDRLEARIDRTDGKIDKLTESVNQLVAEVKVIHVRVVKLEEREARPTLVQG